MNSRCEPEAFAQWREFVVRAENSPEVVAEITGVPASDIRAAARLYAKARNGAIYYGLGVTEHSQGSTTVMGIANLAMATGIGRPGVGVNPLRGQIMCKVPVIWVPSRMNYPAIDTSAMKEARLQTIGILNSTLNPVIGSQIC